MTTESRELHIARALDDYAARRAEGLRPTQEDYAQRLGDAYEEFCSLLTVDDALAEMLDPPSTPPVPLRPLSKTTGLRLLGRPVVLWATAAAAALLLALGLGAFTSPSTPNTVTFEVASLPAAEVLVDGTSHGTTPLRLALAPGEHRIALHREGFEPVALEKSLPAEAGGTWTPILRPAMPDDALALKAIGDAILGPGTALDVTPRRLDRSVGAESGALLFPAGPVRLEDLDEVWVDADDSVPPDCVLTFRRGDDVLATVELAIDAFHRRLPFPPAVRAALAPGDTFSIALEGDWEHTRRHYESTCVVLAEDPEVAARLERLSGLLKTEDEASSSTRLWLASRTLLGAGLPWAAYREAHEAARPSDAPNATLVPWLIQREALYRMDRGKTRALLRVEEAIDAFPAAVRARWWPGPDDPAD